MKKLMIALLLVSLLAPLAVTVSVGQANLISRYQQWSTTVLAESANEKAI